MQTLVLPADAPLRSRADWATIGVVGLAHGTSHFFHLLLPPLFPVFAREFQLSWAEMGLLVSVFYAVSGVGQALSGFVVDRRGARPALMVAMAMFALASLAAGVAQGYGGLLLAAALAGLGNSPMHPADFSILNQRVSHARIGHAYSVHGISGNLGWALMPVLVLAVLSTGASWRWVYAATALVALTVLGLLLQQREHLQTEPPPRRAAGAPDAHPLDFLRLPSIWLCFSFFFFTTAALASLQSFAPAALALLHGRSAESMNLVVTAYMLCGAVGMFIGGFIAARVANSDRVVAMAMAAGAALLALCGTGLLGATATMVVLAITGFAVGIGGPSRDMMIKKATPKGATGRVYGLVYSGLDVGFAISPVVFGVFMDRGWYGATLLGAALVLLASVVAALGVGQRTAR